MAKNNELNMTEGPIFKNVFLFTIPLIASGVLQLLYNAADIVVVGRFSGSEALAAVGSTSSLIALLTNLFIGLSVGTSVCTANAFGARDYQKTHNSLHTSVALSLICGVVACLFGLFFSKTALKLMASPPEIIDLSALYLKIYFLGMPAFLFYNFGAMSLRAVGDTKRPLYFLTISGVINVLLNLLLVIVFKMGVAGVAIATIVSQYVSAILILLALLRREGFLSLEIKEIRIHKEELLKILKVGIPAGIQSTIFSLSNVIIQSSVNSFGPIFVAGSAAAANIEGFVYTAMNSFHHTTVTMVGQNYGAKKFDRISKSVLACAISTSLLGGIMGALVVIFRNSLLSIYASDSAVIAAGATRLLVVVSVYFICGLMEVFVGGLRGMGNSIMPMIVSIIGVCGVRIGWIFTVFKAYRSFSILFLSYLVSWLFTTLIHLVCFLVYKRKIQKQEENKLL